MSYIQILGAAATQAAATKAWPPSPIACAVGDLCLIAEIGTSSYQKPAIYTDSAETIDAGYTSINEDAFASPYRVRIFRKKLIAGDIDGSGNFKTVYTGAGGSGGRIMGVILHAAGGFSDNPVVESFAQIAIVANGSSIITTAIGSPSGMTKTTNPQFVMVGCIFASAGPTLVYNWDNPRVDSNGVGGVTVSSVNGETHIHDSAILSTDAGQPVKDGVGYIPAKTLIGSVTPGVSFELVDESGNPVACTGVITSVTVGSSKSGHAPYFNGNGTSGSSDTDGGGIWSANTPGTEGHHYWNNSGSLYWSDFWLYDETDVLRDLSQNIGLGGAHAILIVNIESNPAPSGELSGKGDLACEAKGTLVPNDIELSGTVGIVIEGHGELITPIFLSGKGNIAAEAGAPAGLSDIASTPIELAGFGTLVSEAKAYLYAPGQNYLSGRVSVVIFGKANIQTYVAPTPPPVPTDTRALVWDKLGEHKFETGLDRGVLYLPGKEGIVWNGLLSVSENEKQERSPIFYDGIKVSDEVSFGEFSGKITAITYPLEFEEYQGMGKLAHGISVGDQASKPFSMSYRTQIGTDTDAAGYKLHLLYNIIAVPSERTYETVSDNPSAMEFEWDITAMPEEIPGFRPTAHLVINTMETDPWLMASIEELLYGNVTDKPVLWPMADIVEFMRNWARVHIFDFGNGLWVAQSDYEGLVELLPGGEMFQIDEANIVYVDANTYILSDTASLWDIT